MSEYIKIRWKPETLIKLGLLDMEYPVKMSEFERFVDGEEIQLDLILYWLMGYSAVSPKEWLDCEPAILRLSELIAPPEKSPDNISIAGDNWKFVVGPVDLTQEIVTIQRGDYLLASIQNAGNGQLLVSVYRPLDSKSVAYLTELTLNPAPDGTVCMRPNNWEYALDCSAGTGNMYAADSGASYLSYWEYGLGVCMDGSKLEVWHFQRDMEPIAPKYVAMLVGICYENSLEPDSEPQNSLTQAAIKLIDDFYKVAELSGVELPASALNFEVLPAPHLPPSSLPRDTMAVYVFSWKGQCLKVGKVGSKSHARYSSQHYSPKSSKSNLSKSVLMSHEDMGINITEETVGTWVKNNVDRINYYLDKKHGIRMLSLLETYLQCRLKPMFEGFESQK
jgi:hypothetical protein